MSTQNKIINVGNWQSGNPNLVPIGKRIKRVVHDPDTLDLYYFKEPKEKYPWEFWTEIVSYQIGKVYGFNVLKYDIAISDDIVGCISPSINLKNEELIHGQQLLTQLLPTFETKKGTDHSFQLIEKLFKKDESLKPLLNDFILMLVFDSVIGNRDRHQQNWAIVRGVSLEFKKFLLNAQIFNKDLTLNKLLWQFFKSIFSKEKMKKFGELEVDINEYYKFSPFFDNGNCLAYNIIEENIDHIIGSQSKLENYLFGKKAVSHVKWQGEQITHLELLKKLTPNYKNEIIKGVELINKVPFNQVEEIIKDIDKNIENIPSKYALTLQRKELMCKLVNLRIKHLLESF